MCYCIIEDVIDEANSYRVIEITFRHSVVQQFGGCGGGGANTITRFRVSPLACLLGGTL